nr:hypothetical protein [Saccharothrix sp. ST-888]
MFDLRVVAEEPQSGGGGSPDIWSAVIPGELRQTVPSGVGMAPAQGDGGTRTDGPVRVDECALEGRVSITPRRIQDWHEENEVRDRELKRDGRRPV